MEGVSFSVGANPLRQDTQGNSAKGYNFLFVSRVKDILRRFCLIDLIFLRLYPLTKLSWMSRHGGMYDFVYAIRMRRNN